jgi:hypothetical protein
MKNIKSSFVIILAIALLALTAFSVMAADGDDVILPCAGDADGKVSGTVVAVDGNTVTIHTGDGNYCTVTLNGSYDHPIVSLLGMSIPRSSKRAPSMIRLPIPGRGRKKVIA